MMLNEKVISYFLVSVIQHLSFTNLSEFLQVADMTTLSYEHTELCAESPAEHARCSPDAAIGEGTLKGAPQSSGVSLQPPQHQPCCASCPLQPSVLIISFTQSRVMC